VRTPLIGDRLPSDPRYSGCYTGLFTGGALSALMAPWPTSWSCRLFLIYNSTKRRLHALASLDLRKAIDFVSHHSVAPALLNFGIPEYLQQYITSTFTDASSIIFLGGREVGTVGMRRGVRQGDPLSPLLFDMVVDELLGLLEADGCGAEISGGVGFADDFILLAETPRELQRALDLSAAFFQRRGMVLNPMKSRVLVRRKVSGSIIPVGSPDLTVGQHQPLQVLGDDLRYLRRYATMLDKLPRLVAAPPCLPTEAPSPMYSVPGSASWVMRRAGDPVIVAALSSATVARLLGRLDATGGPNRGGAVRGGQPQGAPTKGAKPQVGAAKGHRARGRSTGAQPQGGSTNGAQSQGGQKMTYAQRLKARVEEVHETVVAADSG
jgi:hypothetical protein